MYSRRDVIKAGLGAIAATLAVSQSPQKDAEATIVGEEVTHPRLRINFNQDYKFLLGDHIGADAENYDDSAWEFVCLPHCFSTPYWGVPDFYVGYGWYRKVFDVPERWLRKKVFVEFEGAFQDAEISINGLPIGEHKGGYTGFVFDISRWIRTGQNLLSIRLNNIWDARTAPRAGEHQFAGGIYRNVWLNVINVVHLRHNGVTISTPQLSKDSAVVAVKAVVQNDSGQPKEVRLHTSVIGRDGSSAVESVAHIESGQSFEFDQIIPVKGKPDLWHPDNPNLYDVSTVLHCDGGVVDELNSPTGLRWFEFSAEQGFFLNGGHYLLKGANVHQDHAGWCNAVTDAGYFRDMQMVKDAGFNFIRGSHYPHPPAFYRACDRLGILVWSELCFWGIGGFGPDGYWNASAYPIDEADEAGFELSCKQTLAEMISQHVNSPCVIVWSMCNEVFFSPDDVMPKVRQLLTELVELTHSLDPTRPAGIGGCQRGDLDKLGDIAGYNGDGARLFMDPGVSSIVSEYGSCGDIRPGGFDPCWGDTAGQTDFPWRSGKALWCMFDHGSIASIGRLGCVDYFRLPKRRWYWYRQNYLGIAPPAWPQPGTPVGLHLTSSSTTISNDGTNDCQIVVTVVGASGTPINNAPPVTLTVETGPGQFPTGRSIPFTSDGEIAIYDGVAAIEFRSQYPGVASIRATSPGLNDASIAITVAGNSSPRNSSQATLPLVMDAPTTVLQVASSPLTDLAAQRPTLASSEDPAHPANDANDSNLSTYWAAGKSDETPWWQVDLENVYVVKETTVTFLKTSLWRYTIDLSVDGNVWSTVLDDGSGQELSQSVTHKLPPNSQGRFLRITFTSVPAEESVAIREITVRGSAASTAPK